MKEVITGAAAGYIIVSIIYNVIGNGMTGIVAAAIGGIAIGGLVYYVLGYDNGYAKGRRDERLGRFRRRENGKEAAGGGPGKNNC